MMSEEFLGRIKFTYIKCHNGNGGYLISDEPISSFLASEPTRCVNVWLKKSFKSLPAIGFSLRGPAVIRPDELSEDPEDLGEMYLICVFNDPAMPAWCFKGAERGDRLRMRFEEESYGLFKAQFRLNQLPPTHPYDVQTTDPIYFIIRAGTPDDVAILTENEVVYCRATGVQPSNRIGMGKPKQTIVTPKSDMTRSSSSSSSLTSPLQSQAKSIAPPASNNQSSNQQRAVFPECVVCTDRHVELLNFPCQHATSCGQCFEDECKTNEAKGELKCSLCRKKIVHTRRIVEVLEKCAFNGCSQMDAAAMPCGCVVGCFAEASKLNGFVQRGERPPRCPACGRDVAAFHQVYFP